MVIDKVQDRCIPRYLVYDIIRYENNDVGKLPFFPDRLKCIKKEIIGNCLNIVCIVSLAFIFS